MPSVTRRGLAAALAVAAVVCAFVAYGSPLGMDYLAPPCHGYVCDDAGPSIEALAHGHVHDFFAQQPPMGGFSLLLRAPAAAVTNAAGGHELAAYRGGAFMCLLALALLAVWTMAQMLARGRPRVAAYLIPTALVVSPLTYAALQYGHPEELLCSALVVGGVLAAGRGRGLAAGALLGLAVATKQWAILALPAALIAAPGARVRVRLALSAVGLGGLFTLPMLIGDPSRFALAQKSVSTLLPFHDTVTASNVWFPLASSSTAATATPSGMQVTAQYSLPDWLGHLTHPLVIAIAVGLYGLYAVRRRGAGAEEVLQLLALVFLVRCVLDPLTYSYHHAPFLVALTTYEALRRRVPVMSGFAIAAILLMTHVIAPLHDPALVNAFYLAWSLPLVAALGLGVLAPERLDALAARFSAARPARA